MLLNTSSAAAGIGAVVALLDCGEVGGVAESGTNGGEGGVQADGREASGGGERTDMSDDKDRVVLVGTNRRGGRARGGDKRRWRDTTEEGVGVYEACMYEGEASGGGCSGGLGEAECGDDYPIPSSKVVRSRTTTTWPLYCTAASFL